MVLFEKKTRLSIFLKNYFHTDCKGLKDGYSIRYACGGHSLYVPLRGICSRKAA